MSFQSDSGRSVSQKDPSKYIRPVIFLRGCERESTDYVQTLITKAGFKILYYHEADSGANFDVVVALTQKLFLKLALQNGLIHRGPLSCTEAERSRIVQKSLPILKNLFYKVKQLHLGHDENSITIKYLKEELPLPETHTIEELLNGYFGATISCLFAWLHYYKNGLLPPAILGIVVLIPIIQIQVLLHLLLIFGSLVATRLWHRILNELHYKCSTHDLLANNSETAFAQQVNHSLRHGPFINRARTYLLTIPATCAVIAFQFLLSHWILLQLQLTASTITTIISSYSGLLGGLCLWATQMVIYLVIILLPFLHVVIADNIVAHIVRYEDHYTEIEAEHQLQFRRFLFHAFAHFGYITKDLLYDHKMSRSTLCYLVLAQFLVQLLLSHRAAVMALLKKYGGDRMEALQSRRASRRETFRLQSFERRFPNAKQYQEDMDVELKMKDFKTTDRISSLLLEYGYIVIFGAVSPLLATVAFLANHTVMKFYLKSLPHHKRPVIDSKDSFEGLTPCFNLLNLAGVAMNSYLMFISPPASDPALRLIFWALSFFANVTDDSISRWIIFIIFEHIIVLFYISLQIIIEDIPPWISHERAFDQSQRRKEILDARVQLLWDGKYPPLVETRRQELDVDHVERHIANIRVLQHQSSFGNHISELLGVAYGHSWHWLVLVSPWIAIQILSCLGLGRWWFLPVSVLSLSYVWTGRKKAEKHIRAGLLQDPEVLKAIFGDLPKWLSQSDNHNMNFINSMLQKTWPFLYSFLNSKFYNVFQPKLDASKPSFVKSLRLRNIDIGKIAPVIKSIRVFKKCHKENFIRFDMNFAYTGDAVIPIDIDSKRSRVRMKIENMSMEYFLRLQWNPLTDSMPPFSAATVSFLRKPSFDFTFRLGKFDISRIGVSETSLGSAVTKMIRSIACDMAFYPKRLVVRLVPDPENALLKQLEDIRPVGVMKFKIVNTYGLNVSTLKLSHIVIRIDCSSQKFYTKPQGKDMLQKRSTSKKSKKDKASSSSSVVVVSKESYDNHRKYESPGTSPRSQGRSASHSISSRNPSSKKLEPICETENNKCYHQDDQMEYKQGYEKSSPNHDDHDIASGNNNNNNNNSNNNNTSNKSNSGSAPGFFHWDAYYEVLIYERDCNIIEFSLYNCDKKMATIETDCFGHAQFDVNLLIPYVALKKVIPIHPFHQPTATATSTAAQTTQGSKISSNIGFLELISTYMPLQSDGRMDDTLCSGGNFFEFAKELNVLSAKLSDSPEHTHNTCSMGSFSPPHKKNPSLLYPTRGHSESVYKTIALKSSEPDSSTQKSSQNSHKSRPSTARTNSVDGRDLTGSYTGPSQDRHVDRFAERARSFSQRSASSSPTPSPLMVPAPPLKDEEMNFDDNDINRNDSGIPSEESSLQGFSDDDKDVDEMPVQILKISEIYCKNLNIKYTFGLIRPFVTFEYGDNRKKTSVMSGIENPVFRETINFVIKNVSSDEIVVKIMQKSTFMSDDVLAMTKIRVQDVFYSDQYEFVLKLVNGKHCLIGMKFEILT